MSHTISGKLRKAPFIKDGCGKDGNSTMYAIELAEQVSDRQTGEKTYTNYKAAIFASSQGQKSFYDNALSEGSFVVVSCEKLKVESREHNGKTYITLNMENARLENAMFAESGNQQQQPQGQQQAPQQRQQGVSQYDYDQSIPFAPLGHSFPRHAIQSI